ncbi:unnamed protein product [Protopolystoma xenopodis]|uniref:Uncharacterized protein n=1 Tax=Protopolystoma xenopodis TaxID=117903 RepID=A0A448X6F1_9PLAT|nr:unnamed protein product [Protopolystoma xenopodis]
MRKLPLLLISDTLSRASQRRNLIASQQRLQRCRDISSLRRRQHQQQTGQRLPSDLRRPENGMKDWTHWHESRIMNESDCVTAPLLNQSRRLSCSSRSDSFSSTSNQPLLSPHSSHASQSTVGSSAFSLGRAPPLLRQVERHSAIPRSLSERASLANRSPENFAFGPNEDVEYGEEVVGEVWGDAFASLESTTLVCESHRQDIETKSSKTKIERNITKASS